MAQKSDEVRKWSWHGTTAAKPRAMSLLNGRGAKEEDKVNRRQAESHELIIIHSLEEARLLETPPEVRE